VQLFLAALNEEGEQLGRSALWAAIFRLGCRSNQFAYVGLLIRREQIGNFTSVEDVVDVLKESFLLDLSICEDEGSCHSLATAQAEQVFHVVTPLLHTVVLLDLHLINLVVAHLRS
jgi:hypothetical protein